MRYDTANESIVLSSVANGTWSTKATYYFEPSVGDDVTIVIGYNNDTPSDHIIVYVGGTQRINQTVGTTQRTGKVAFGGGFTLDTAWRARHADKKGEEKVSG